MKKRSAEIWLILFFLGSASGSIEAALKNFAVQIKETAGQAEFGSPGGLLRFFRRFFRRRFAPRLRRQEWL